MSVFLTSRTLISELATKVGKTVTIRCCVHNRRDLGGIQFLHLRDRSGAVQCVFEDTELPLFESCIEVSGTVENNTKAPGGIELHCNSLEIINVALAPPPIEIPKEEVHVNAETLLEYRHVSIRGLKTQATLKIQAELGKAFRQHLDQVGFTEIFTPKLVSAAAEGGANLFEVDYYGKRAYLAQSPQLYKQIMVGVYEQVYEVAPVYRAELSHTSRHLSEYLSLDVEFGFIEDDTDVMDLQENLIKGMLTSVKTSCKQHLEYLEAEFPNLEVQIPRIPLMEARKLVAEHFNHQTGGKDLDPEAERLLGRWAKEKHGSDFIFVTNYPKAARPFYTYPTEDGLTRGLDLIFRGVEITSGGQRIHDYKVLLSELNERQMNPEDFRGYLEVFKHGMPPHGGFAIGAERLTALLLGISNVRFARAFPRDGGRLIP